MCGQKSLTPGARKYAEEITRKAFERQAKEKEEHRKRKYAEELAKEAEK